MPLTFANVGETCLIQKISGKEDIKKFLQKLGFVTGGYITVISKINENIIVNIKESRVALGRDMANKIIVSNE